MQISQRIKSVTGDGSDGWDVFYRARKMIADGIPVTELTIGEHDIRTAPKVLDAMHAAARDGATGYAAVPGIASLREAIAQRITRRTCVPTTARNVVITPGGQSGLFAAHLAALDPGNAALCVDPYYTTYPGTIRSAGGKMIPVPARAEDGFQPRRNELEHAAKGIHPRSLLINSPNNPTGAVYSDTTLREVCDFVKDRDLWLISDEVYDTQIWTGSHLSPRALPGMAERTLVVGSMSKSHAMTGSRIGWVVGPEDVIASIANLATHTTYGVPGYIQEAALFALNEGPDFEAEVKAPFARRSAAVLQQIAGQSVVSVIPSGGTMYLMLDIRATGLSGEDFAHRLLEAHQIAVMPGESFGSAAAGHLRLALTVADDALMRAVATLLSFAATLAK